MVISFWYHFIYRDSVSFLEFGFLLSIVISCQPFTTSIVITHQPFPPFIFSMLYFSPHLLLSLIYFSSCLLFTSIHHSRSTIILQLAHANHPDAHSSRRPCAAAVNAESVRLSLCFPPVYPSKPCLQRLCRFKPFTAVLRRFSSPCVFTRFTL